MRQHPFQSGGKHQRLKRARSTPARGANVNVHGAASSSSAPRPTFLASDPEVEILVELFTLGLLSVRLVREIAHCSNLAAPREPMAVLAGLGAGGAHVANAHRDLQRRLNMDAITLPEPVYPMLPLWDASARPPWEGHHALPDPLAA